MQAASSSQFHSKNAHTLGTPRTHSVLQQASSAGAAVEVEVDAEAERMQASAYSYCLFKSMCRMCP